MRRKERDSISGIDTKEELGAYAIKSVLRQWWKVALIVLIAGLAVSGYSIKCGKVSVEKKSGRSAKERQGRGAMTRGLILAALLSLIVGCASTPATVETERIDAILSDGALDALPDSTRTRVVDALTDAKKAIITANEKTATAEKKAAVNEKWASRGKTFAVCGGILVVLFVFALAAGIIRRIMP